ncbi:MAG: DUF2461 domain-containing protein [Petrimonas sp.]|nr:DUF2461 domain-containing protein [Petrimonas sp.]
MKQVAPFTGFRPETIQFLKELKENNYKQWFEEHKHVYQEHLMEPLKSFATTTSLAMHNLDPAFDLRLVKMLSRIYRDVRFSINKDPYNSNMWINYQRQNTHWESFPGFFAEIGTEHFMYGMGLFMPKRKMMDRLREEISYCRESFEKMSEKALSAGFVIEGDKYKRELANNLPEAFQPWMHRKNVYVVKTLPLSDERIYSEAIALQLIEDFSQIADLYQFMVSVVEEADQGI